MNSMTKSESAIQERIYTVSEINAEVQDILDDHFTTIRMQGEISNLTIARSGHAYFILKDKSSQIRCTLFRGVQYRLRVRPEEGRQVILTGRINLYSARGSFQFNVQHLEVIKQGDLYLAFEELKRKLRNKGYFDTSRKKSLPNHPKVVGVITSTSGAAIEDIKGVFLRRNPSIKLVIYPVRVQGDGSAAEIANAIQYANDRQKEHVLIVARGGGSIEDLWAFNEEIVANAIFECNIPIITGVGHQTDFTIADFVADQRAATPTAAGEILTTPSREEMLKDLENRANLMGNRLLHILNNLSQKVDLADRSLVHPKRKLENLRSKIQHGMTRLNHLSNNKLDFESNRIHTNSLSLLHKSPMAKINKHQNNLQRRCEQLLTQIQYLHEKKTALLHSLHSQLAAVNPDATLSRGYAIVRRADDDSIVSQASSVKGGDKINIQLSKGKLLAEVENIET